MRDDFKDKRVLLTGGSRGLGKALARELACRGARVVAVARDEHALRAAQAQLTAEGAPISIIVGDVGIAADAIAIAGQAHAQLGGVDILIHNASSLGPLPMPTLADLESSDFAKVLEVNLLGPHRLTQAIAGNMLLQGGGTILSISSDAATQAYANWGAYSAAKVALDHLSRIWAEESAGSGLRFLSVDPGEMDTQMHADALPEADPQTLEKPDRIARLIASLLLDPQLASGSRHLAHDMEARA